MKLFISVFLAVSLFLASCSKSKMEGYGVVENEKKLGGIDYVPKESTGVGVAAGAGTGIVGGAVVGAAAGAAASVAAAPVTLGLTIILMPAMVITCAVPAAITGGIIGGVVGGGGGYVYGINEQGLGVFKVKITKIKVEEDAPVIYEQNLKENFAHGTIVKIYRDYKFSTPLGYHIEKASPEEAEKIKGKAFSRVEKKKD